jgi:hypothetical protein
MVPVGVELLIAYIKGERYSLPRAAAVLAGVLVALILLMVLRGIVQHLRLLLEFFLLVFCISTTAVGVFAVVAEPRDDVDVLGITVGFLGLLVAALAGYSIYVEQSGADLLFATAGPAAGQVRQKFTETNCLVTLTKFPKFHAGDEEVLSLCRVGVHPDDLHFVGYYVDGVCRFYLDALDNSQLNRHFRGFDRDSRRLSYEHAGRQLFWTMSRLEAYLRKLNGGILIRTVLDVEEGALYYYWIDKNVYLTGITMDQSKVLDVDEKLRRIANEIGVLPRGRTPIAPNQPRARQVVAPDGPPIE